MARLRRGDIGSHWASLQERPFPYLCIERFRAMASAHDRQGLYCTTGISPTYKVHGGFSSLLDFFSRDGGKCTRASSVGLIAPADLDVSVSPCRVGPQKCPILIRLAFPDGCQVAVGSRSSAVRAAFQARNRVGGAYSTGIYSYSTAVGFCAVYTKNPRYEDASSGRSGHTDAVRVPYRSSMSCVSFGNRMIRAVSLGSLLFQ
jgi:Peptide methionine sulfoxide reductase